MSGIGALRDNGLSSLWQQARYYSNLSAARAAAANPARAETPVEPVQPVRALPSDTPVRFPVLLTETRLPAEEDLNNAQETLVKMRIQYPGEEAEAQETAMPQLQQLRMGDLETQLAWKQGELDDAEAAELAGEGAEAEAPEGEDASKSPAETMEEAECETCENRMYQDGSDDPGVSFKMPTKISADQAAAAVRGHEMEHVVRERAKAEREGREVISQTVTIQTAVCPECGRVYVSGGVTRTVTAKAPDAEGEDSSMDPQATDARERTTTSFFDAM